MSKPRRKVDALKAKIALEALREPATAADRAVRYEIHPKWINALKKQLLDNAPVRLKPGSVSTPGTCGNVRSRSCT